MKFYNSIGPNPKVVRMFMAEKGGSRFLRSRSTSWPGKIASPDYLKVNPSGQCPALELDNGQCISEILAICEYLEEVHPEPALIGSTPEERGEARMLARPRSTLGSANPWPTASASRRDSRCSSQGS